MLRLGFAANLPGIPSRFNVGSSLFHRDGLIRLSGGSRFVSSSSEDEAEIKKKLIADITRKLQGMCLIVQLC